MTLLKNGDCVRVVAGTPSRFDKGVYSLDYDAANRFYYLSKQPDFVFPAKIYGEEEIKADCDRWLGAFERTHKNLGIALIGVKGSGKSMTAQYLCAYSKKPVILITKQIHEHTVDAFFEIMKQPELKGSLVFIDEFEKIFGKPNSFSFDDEERDEMDRASLIPVMQLMDGNYATRFLFLVTANSRLDSHFVNRLGRIRYRKIYESLDNKVIEAYLLAELSQKRQRNRNEIITLLNQLGFASYDFLHHFVDELNNNSGSPMDCLLNLNVAPAKHYYDIHVRRKGGGEWCAMRFDNYNLSFDKIWVACDGRKSSHQNYPNEVIEFAMNIQLTPEELASRTPEGIIIQRKHKNKMFEIKISESSTGWGAFGRVGTFRDHSSF